MKASELKERLMTLINDLSEDQQRDLLNYLDSQKTGDRKRPRTDCNIPADYSISEKTFKDLIKNISASGVYITSNHIHSIGREISMDFKLTGYTQSIRVFGKIVRSDAKGFAVEFYEEIKDLIADNQTNHIRPS